MMKRSMEESGRAWVCGHKLNWFYSDWSVVDIFLFFKRTDEHSVTFSHTCRSPSTPLKRDSPATPTPPPQSSPAAPPTIFPRGIHLWIWCLRIQVVIMVF